MRTAALAAGLAALALIWLGPLLGPDRASFAAHMLAHMGVVAIAAPLLAIGLAGRVAFGSMPQLPILASLVELVLVWFWHAPTIRAAAEASAVVTVVEQASFLLGGVLLWSSCLAGRPGTGAIALLFTSMHMTLLGALLALAPRPLYGFDDVTCLGMPLSAAQDQQVGGVAMLAVGALVYLAGGLVLAHRVLDRAAEPTGIAP